MDWGVTNFTDKLDKQLVKDAMLELKCAQRIPLPFQDIANPDGSLKTGTRYNRSFNFCKENNLPSLGIIGGPNVMDMDTKTFEYFVSNVVRTFYDPATTVGFEFFNEFDLDKNWHPVNYGMYTQYLKRAYDIIKKIDPNIKVVLGGMSTKCNWSGVLTQIYNNGGKWAFDVVNAHTYSGSGSAGAYKNLRTTMRNYWDSWKPVWITETGWKSKNATDLGQATNLTKNLNIMKTWEGLKAIYVFCAADPPDPKHEAYGLGLLTSDGIKKPAFQAYKDVIALG